MMLFNIKMNFRLMITSSIFAFLLASSDPSNDDYPQEENIMPQELFSEYGPSDGRSVESVVYENEEEISRDISDLIADNREALDTLFGHHPGKTQSLVVDRVVNQTNYWLLDEAQFAIEKELNNTNKKHNMSSDDLQRIDVVMENIQLEMDRWPSYPSYDVVFFDQLNKSRAIIDWALGRHSRNDHFSALERSFIVNQWLCLDSMPALWRALLNVDYTKGDYTLKEALETLVLIDHAGRKKQNLNLPTDTLLNEIKLEFLMIASDPINRNYLLPLLCDGDNNCPNYDDVLCHSNPFIVISQLMSTIETNMKVNTPASPERMFILLDIVRSLNDIAKQVTTTVSFRSGEAEHRSAERMLVCYLGIIDVAFGYNSTETWRRTTMSTALAQFQRILIENEDYVGFIANMILNKEAKEEEINVTTVNVQMRRVPSDSDRGERIQFSFENVQIWTDEIASNGTDSNVYAISYESWNEVLGNITGSSEFNNSLPRSKILLGKGGVVSLTSQVNKKKNSVPVYYRINFQDKDVFHDESGKVARRCLSCGFFDVTSQSWKSDGCYVSSADDVGVTCRCNHTTNFAAFMSPYENEYDITDNEDLWLNIFEYVGSITSAIGLTASFLAFYIVRNAVRNDRLKAHMNLVAALLFVHLIQIGAEFAVTDDTICTVTTIATHYFLLASFMWMLIEGIFLYFYVVQVFVRSRTESKKWMYITGWLAPLLIVGVSAGYGLSNDSYIKRNEKTSYPCDDGQLMYPPLKEPKYSVCWLNPLSGMTWAFVGPAIAVVALNLVILCKVVVALAKLSVRSKEMKKNQIEDQNGDESNKADPKGTPKLLSFKTKTYEVQEDGRVNWFNQDPIKHPGLPSYSPQQHQEPYPVLTFNSNRRRYLQEAKRTVKGAAVLLPLLGIGWILGTFAYKSFAFSLMFVILNSVQGVAIFLIYCVFNGEVYRALQRRLATMCVSRKGITRRRSISSGSVKSVLSKSMLRNWTRRSTTTPMYRSSSPA